MFDLKSFYAGFETILNVNPDCWWLNSTITNDLDLDWVNRFGSFTSNITQLRINIHTSSTEAMLNFDAGLNDILLNLGSKSISSIDCNIQEKMSFIFTFLGYGIRSTDRIIGNREPCANDPSITKGLAVRKAISYAINRDEFNTIVHSGEGYVVDNPFFEARKIWCNPNIIQYNHDLEKAKYYMELAGYAEPVIMGFEFADWLCLSFIVSIFILTFKRKQRMRK
ncbi:MAG: ABC transporter substrate-binding protein [Candidatus Heimdallarchaeota archaeon]